MTKKSETTEIQGVELSKQEIEDAKKEGALDYVRESGARAMAIDTVADWDGAAEREKFRVRPDLQSTFLSPLLELGLDELKDRLTDSKRPDFIAFEEAKGLLHLERSGQNRTEHVKLLCKVIGVKSPTEVSNAGPSYTNDVTNITKLD